MKKFSENCFGLTEQIKVGTLEYNISKQRSYFVSYLSYKLFCLKYVPLILFFVLQNPNKPSAHIESVNRGQLTYQANQSICFFYYPLHR